MEASLTKFQRRPLSAMCHPVIGTLVISKNPHAKGGRAAMGIALLRRIVGKMPHEPVMCVPMIPLLVQKPQYSFSARLEERGSVRLPRLRIMHQGSGTRMQCKLRLIIAFCVVMMARAAFDRSIPSIAQKWSRCSIAWMEEGNIPNAYDGR